MRSSRSPPQQAAHIRHQQLTPESPRPQNNPSPSNIPILILDQQMDPVFHDPAHSTNGASTPYYADQPPATAFHHHHHHQHNVGAHGPGGGAAPAGFAQAAFGSSGGSNSMGAHALDTSSIQTFSAQHQSRAPSSSDAQQAPGTDHRAAYPFAHDSPAQPALGAHYQPATGAATVDIQALLDSLTPSAGHAPSAPYAAPHMSTQSAFPQPNASASSLPAAPSLPARPPAQDKPATHPNYSPNDDIRSFHPHSQQPANPQLPPTNVRAQDSSSAPASASRPSAQSPGAAGNLHRQSGQQPGQQRSATPDDEDARWPPEINKKYEEFLDQERKFVTEGQWDQFPVGSRLFIGNLPSEKVTKRDVFHRFYRYGKLAQISIKQAYGFVQFLDAESCRQALQAQDRQTIRGKPMHLEISKPQRNTKKTEAQNNGARRRSRSPDYTRGGPGPARDGRYNGNQTSMSPRDRRFRDRDDYRPMRSPSPRGGGGGGGGGGGPRGGRQRERSRDRYDSRHRSRSRSPPRRYRSRSPRRDFVEDDLDGLPRRLPHQVPEIQVLVSNQGLPSDFIRYVEDTFRTQGLRCDVLIMSGRFPEPAIVRRQILEGVLAIVRLDSSSLVKGNVNVQVFDRRSGATNVQFNEYADLDLTTVSMLVNQAKQSQSQPVQPPAPTYGYNQYSQPPPAMFPPAQPPPNLSNVLASLNPNALAQLLGAMSSQTPVHTPQPAPAAPAGLNVDIARLLAQVSQPPAQLPVQQPQSQSQTPGYTTPQQFANQFPGLAGLLGGHSQAQGQGQIPATTQPPPQQQQQHQHHHHHQQQQQQTPTGQNGAANVDMSEIMAQLQKYQR